jgi:glutamate-1-semialdehyde 2,1-aminomutase
MHGGTYNSSPLVCAAVIAALQVTGERDFYSDLGRRGLRLATGLMDTAHDAGLDAAWAGVGQMGQLWFAPRAPTTYRQSLEMIAASPFFTLYEEFRRRGVIIQPPQEGLFFVSSPHSEADIERTIEIAREAMPLVAQAAAAGHVGPRGGVR